MLRFLGVVVAALLVSGWAAVPKSFKFGPTSQEGMFVVELNASLPIFRGSEASIDLVRFDPESSKITANAFTGWASVNEVKLQPGRPSYLVGRAKPGRYVLRSLNHRSRWQACFNTATVQLDIKPGTVVFLGRIDPTQPLIELATKAPSSTRSIEFVLDTPRLDLRTPGELGDWRAPVSRFLAASHAGVTASLEAADIQPAVFRSGVGLTGEKICSSYGSEKKPKS